MVPVYIGQGFPTLVHNMIVSEGLPLLRGETHRRA